MFEMVTVNITWEKKHSNSLSLTWTNLQNMVSKQTKQHSMGSCVRCFLPRATMMRWVGFCFCFPSENWLWNVLGCSVTGSLFMYLSSWSSWSFLVPVWQYKRNTWFIDFISYVLFLVSLQALNGTLTNMKKWCMIEW